MMNALVPRSFQARLLLAFATLLTVAVSGAGLAVGVSSTQQVREQMQQKALVGARVLDSHLQARREQLASAVHVLTHDFGFKSAVATGDTATVASALANHSARIGADLMVLLGRDGNAVGRAGPLPSNAVPFRAEVARAQTSGALQAVGAHDGALFQYFVVPMLAPTPIAWVVVGFTINAAFALEIAQLTDLGVGFVALDAAGRAAASVGFHDDAHLQALLADLGRGWSGGPLVTTTHDGDYLSAVSVLDDRAGQRVFAVLQIPTRMIAETVRWQLLQIALVLALAATLAAGVWLARRISRPVRQLIDGARGIERGDYDTPVATESDGEMALLGSALNTMRDAVRDREARIRHQADHDPVTDLPNLRYLERLAREQDRPFALCLVGLLDLKDVSFSLGHETADALLVAVARRLRAEPDVLTVARVGGNEFAVLLPAMPADHALFQARRINSAISRAHAVNGRTVATRSACAVISFPEDADSFQTLFRRVETTLTAARAQPDRCAAYQPGHEAARERRLRIIAGFDNAFDDGQFYLQFQPKVTLPGLEVRECEALLRWRHPELGAVPPDEFVQLAERSGNIRRMSDWVLDRAVAQAGEWRRRGLDMAVAINLSAHDLADASLDHVVADTLRRHGVDGRRVILEITESAVMLDRERAVQTLRRLKALGIRLSIDDFGTGHSSLAQLKTLPVDELKIDKSFVLHLDRSLDDALIVRSTIELGHNLGLKVVAEGVENAASVDLLGGYSCDKVQGYHFARPLDAEAFEHWLGDYRRRLQPLCEANA